MVAKMAIEDCRTLCCPYCNLLAGRDAAWWVNLGCLPISAFKRVLSILVLPALMMRQNSRRWRLVRLEADSLKPLAPG